MKLLLRIGEGRVLFIAEIIYRNVVLLLFLQLLYILGVYWVGPDIASAFQVRTACDQSVTSSSGQMTSHVSPSSGHMTSHVSPSSGHMTSHVSPSSGHMTGYVSPSCGHVTSHVPPALIM